MRGHQRKPGKETFKPEHMWKSQQASDNKGRLLFTFPGTVPLLDYTLAFALLSTALGESNTMSPVGPKSGST